jgi:hypothetical protein
MDTKVAKITRSWTSPVMSSPTPLREPSFLRRSPPSARSHVFLTSNGLRRAAPSQESQCPRFEAGCSRMGGILYRCFGNISDCDGKPHRRRRRFASKFVDRAGGTRGMYHGTSWRSV